MAISIIFSSIHNKYYHYQQNMTPENYKIQVLLRTEGFFRQRKKSRVISKIDSTTGSFNRYETGLGPPMVGRRGRCVKHWSRTPADPGSIPGAGDKNKRLISLPCNIRRCAPRGSHIT